MHGAPPTIRIGLCAKILMNYSASIEVLDDAKEVASLAGMRTHSHRFQIVNLLTRHSIHHSRLPLLNGTEQMVA